MKIAYYPGCLLADSARAYDDSLRACAKALGDELVDFQWHCCGGVSFASADPEGGRALVEGLFKKAAETGARRLLVPCPYCMDNLRLCGEHPPMDLLSAAAYFAEPERAEKAAKAGNEALKGLRAALFPGCRAAAADEQFFAPLKSLLEKLGVEVVKWSYRELCCGGWRAKPLPGEALAHCAPVFEEARTAGADAIVTTCPVCQVNLDLQLTRAEQHLERALDVPTFFVSEIVGHALGSRRTAKWYRRHITSPWPLVETLVEQTFANGEQKDE